MKLSLLTESANNPILFKFIESDKSHINRIPGYTIPFDDLLRVWSEDPDHFNKNEEMERWHAEDDGVGEEGFLRRKREYERKFEILGPHVNVPYPGNLYQVHYHGPIIRTPWDLHTPGYHKRVKFNQISIEDLRTITSANTPEEGYEIYKQLGYGGLGQYERHDNPGFQQFHNDIVRSVPAHHCVTTELLVNVPTEMTFMMEPNVKRSDTDSSFSIEEIKRNLL